MGSLSSTITDRANAAVGAANVAGNPRLVYVWSVVGYNKDTSSTQTLYFSDVGFRTGASDTPAHTIFKPRLVVPSLTASLLGPNVTDGEHRGIPGLKNFAPPEIAPITLINLDTDPDDGTGPLDDYADRDKWSFAGRECKLEVGATDLAYPSQFETVLGLEGVVQSEPVWDSRGNLVFTQAPPLERFGLPYKQRFYGGWGAALQFNGTTNYINYGNRWNFGAHATCMEWRLSWPDKATARRIDQKRATLSGATDNGFSFHINTSKQLIFSCSDGTNSGSLNMGSAGAYDDDVKRMFSINYNPGVQIQAFVTSVSGATWTTTSLGTISLSGWGPITNALNHISGSNAAGTANFFDGQLDEFRVWRKVKSSDEIKSDAQRSMSGSEPFLVACYKYDDRTGSTGWQEVVGPGHYSLLFNGGTHKVDYGNVLNMDDVTSFSFGRWFKTDAVSSEDFVFGNRSAIAAGNAGYQLSLNDSSGAVSGVFRIDDGTSVKAATSTSSNYGRGAWHFLGGRCDRSAKTIECIMLSTRDGQLEVSATTDITGVGSLSNSNSLLAGQSAAGTLTFAGSLSHGFFIPEALTDAEFRALARYIFDLDTITVPAEAADKETTSGSYWATNENTGSTENDLWSTRDGTITGATWQTQNATINGTATYVSTYEGDGSTGGLSVEASIQGVPKPETWGQVTGMPLIMVDQNDNGTATPIYQYGDPDEGTSKSVDAVYSGGLVLTLTTGYTVDLTNNAVTLTAPQDEQLTADLKGYVDGSSNLIERTADIAEQLFTNIGETSLETASFTSVNTSYPYRVGVGIPPLEINTEDLIDSVLRPSVWGTKTVAGEIRLGAFTDIDGEAADFELTTANVVRDGVVPLAVFPPASRVELGFRRNEFPLTSFLGGVQAPDQLRQSKSYSWIGANAAGIETQHKDARVIRLTSRIHRKRDAQIEASRLVDILSRPLMVLRVNLAKDLFKAEIGDVVKLTYPRFGFSAGKNFLCVGYTYPKSPSIDLWGPFTAA